MSKDLVPLDEHRARKARELTDRIRQAAEDLWTLLLEAYEEQAWADLGYESWRDWASIELGWSQSRAYQLLDQGRVIRALEEASSSTKVEIDERTARDLKPHLEVVKDAIRQAIEDVPEERVAEVVAEVIEQERARIVRRRQDREEIEALNAEHDPGPDFDWAHDQELLREGGAIARVIRELAGFRAADEVLAEHPKGDFGSELIAAARRGHDWLMRFVDSWEAR